jgi:hypothetical protein
VFFPLYSAVPPNVCNDVPEECQGRPASSDSKGLFDENPRQHFGERATTEHNINTMILFQGVCASMPERSKGIVSSTTSFDCVGSNPTGCINFFSRCTSKYIFTF